MDYSSMVRVRSPASRSGAAALKGRACVKIKLVEIAKLHQARDIADHYRMLAQFEHAAAPQLLDHPIDMHWAEPECVGQVDLCHGEFVAIRTRQTHRLEAL